MKPLLAALFYLVATVILAVGVWRAVDAGSLWLMLVGILAYLGLFTKFGCLSH